MPHHGRGTVRSVVLGGVLGLLVGIGSGAAYAAYASSNAKWFTVNGHDYSNRSVIYDDSRGQTIQVHSGGTVPAGWMGARARVYWDSGRLCAESTARYNPTADYWFDVVFDSGCGGYVYSQGITKTWNGNGYTDYWTYRTPNIGPL